MQKQCRIVFLDGAFMDFVPPQDFHFPSWIKTVRADGYMLAEGCYVRWDLVRCAVMWDESNPPAIRSTVPGTETRQ